MKPKVKQILLFLFLLLASNVFSNIDSLKKALQTKDFKEVKRYLQDFKKTPNNYSAYSYGENLIDSYYAMSLQFQTINKFDSVQNLKTNLYTINILSNHYEIIYYSLTDNGVLELKNNFKINNTKELLKHLDTSAFQKFKNRIDNQNYGSNVKLTTLFDLNIIYANGIGFAGEDPNQRLLMTEYILNKDSNSLFSWFCNPNIPLQLYALEGFYKLEKKGMYLSDLQWQMVQHMKTLNGTISSWSGCFPIGRNVKEVVERFKFKKRKKQKKKVN